MKELIEKLSIGETEYNKPPVEIDVQELSFLMEAEKTERKSFTIRSMSEKRIKGIIFSTSEHITIENNQFIGINNEIVYIVSTRNMNPGDRTEAKINIISSSGEYSIPVIIEVEATGLKSSIGNVKNLFHFANIAQISFDEAVRLFENEKFPDIILNGDMKLTAIYNGLMGSNDMNVSVEEFLIATNKKKPVHISISKELAEYRDLEDDFGDMVNVIKDTWGYVNIKAEVYGSFIRTDKKRLSSNDFAGGSYEFNYYIKKEKLRPGKNEGKIRFGFNEKYIDLDIIVYEKDIEAEEKEKKRLIKKAKYEIFNNYLEFRLRKIDAREWADRTDKAVARARSNMDSMEMKLFQAQLFINNGRESDAAWLLENVEGELLENKEKNIDLYCYYLYVKTLQNRNDSYISEVIDIIKGYYENGHDSWVILWILMYLDETYEENPSKKLIRIKEQFRKGVRSPLMYYDALVEFNKMPEMLRVLEDFEIQVINFGIKHNCVKRKLALQINELVSMEKRVHPLIYKAMGCLYDKYECDELVESLCSLLIKAGMTDHKYFEWYERGVEKGLKITRLYEYFMFSINPEYNKLLPQIILMYFSYNASMLPDDRRDFLYSNIVRHKEENRQIYEAYKPQMEKYVADCIMAGRVNRYLADVYKDILTNAMVNNEIADKLPDILNSYEIKCYDDNMREVIIVHKELNSVEKYPIADGVAHVHIHTEDAAIVFEDVMGRKHCATVQYEKKKLLRMDYYLEMCYSMVPDNKALIRYFSDRFFNYNVNGERSMRVLRGMIGFSDISDAYRELIDEELINYFDGQISSENIQTYIQNTAVSDFGKKFRVRITEICITRGMYEKAYELIASYGYDRIDSRNIMKCAAKLIEAEKHIGDELLTSMISYAFKKGKYNETTLKYLSRYYYGTTKEMFDIWKAAKDFECEDRELEEKIIVQMLFTGAYVGRETEVFASYYKKHPDKKVKRAYLFSKSYDYFVKEAVVGDCLFQYIRNELLSGEKLCDITELAYLKYMSEQDYLPENEYELCRDMIYDLTRVGKIFEFFKKYKKYFIIPYEIIDRTIVEYRTLPVEHVYIKYYDDMNSRGEKTQLITDEMKKICDGVYTYSFLMFYDEKIQYYIVEDEDGGRVTESMELTVSEVDFSNDDTHYGLINDMLVCAQMKEEKTLGRMAREYYIRKMVGENVFTTIM